VLCEAGLLPGALLRNAGQRFISRPVTVRVENTTTPFTTAYQQGDTLVVPVANGEGRYVAPDDVLRRLEDEGRVVLRYLENPNGSAQDIAAVANATGNVVGMMPHPERAVDRQAGLTDGLLVFESIASGAGLITGGTR
jgi:phosphoribosylformylglycinamidine synthase